MLIRGPDGVEFFRILSPEGKILDEPAFRATGITAEGCRRLYKMLVFVRFFTLRMMEAAPQGHLTLHIGPLGEEAAMARFLGIPKHDYYLSYGRYWDGHIARGVKPKIISDIFCDNPNPEIIKECLEKRSFPPYVSVADQIAQAAGLGLALKLRGDKSAIVVDFGDGATARGDFHSGMNWGSVFKLPIMFFCRNNRRAISTPTNITSATQTFAEKGVAYGIIPEVVDGNDPFSALYSAQNARKRLMESGIATIVELRTRRMGPHTTAVSAIEPTPPEELEAARLEDPLRRMRLFMLSEAKGMLGLEWSKEDDLNLILEIAGKHGRGGMLFGTMAKEEAKNAFAWLTDFLSAEDLDRFENAGGGEARQIILRSAAESEASLASGKELIRENVRLNETPAVLIRPSKESRGLAGPREISFPGLRPAHAAGLWVHDLLSLYENAVYLGEDVGKIGGVMRTTAIFEDIVQVVAPEKKNKILARYLPLKNIFQERVIDTPLDESGIVAAMIGLTLGGMIPIGEMQFSGFADIADHHIRELARLRSEFAGQIPTPAILRMPFGTGKRIKRHNTCELANYLNMPGLIMACPSTLQDFYTIPLAAVCAKPVLLFEHIDLYQPELLLQEVGEKYKKYLLNQVVRGIPEKSIEEMGIRVAKEARPRKDYKERRLTVTAYGLMVYYCLKASELVEKERPDVSIEVLDLRVFPFNPEALIKSVAKTGRLLAVQEEPIYGGTAAEIITAIATSPEAFNYLEAPPARVGTPWTYHPPSKFYKYYRPSIEEIQENMIKILNF